MRHSVTSGGISVYGRGIPSQKNEKPETMVAGKGERLSVLSAHRKASETASGTVRRNRTNGTSAMPGKNSKVQEMLTAYKKRSV